jgi:gamma-glutamyl-gamma-aminobutyraldehyde dehydrogenase
MTDSEQTDWQRLASELRVDGNPFVDGDYLDRPDVPRATTTNPVDGRAGFNYADSDASIVDIAVTAARKAWDEGWRDCGPRDRKRMLLGLADAILANSADLALCDCLDIGKPITAATGEAFPAAGFIRYYAEAIDKIYAGNVAPTGVGAMELQLWKPRGVVGAITPWNFPLINACLKLGPALAAGNTVVIKPSELSPRSTLLLAKIAADAGIPAGVVNVVPGGAVTGQALVGHAGVDMLTFTGSTATGKAVMRAIGDSTIKPVLLECGGKSPEIVFPDVAELGLQEIAAQVVRGAFWNQGQVCVARSRLLVHQDIYQEVLEAVQAVAVTLQPGVPLDAGTMFGPLASARQCEMVESYIQSGIDDGAKLLLDGRSPAGFEQGCYVGPTVFADVPASARIAREEIFGPVLCVMPFADEAEALSLANDTEYGLAATIWTRDIARANRMAGRVHAGKVRVVATLEQLEGAGFAHSAEPSGQSGYGVEGGPNGLRSYMRQQSVELHMG